MKTDSADRLYTWMMRPPTLGSNRQVCCNTFCSLNFCLMCKFKELFLAPLTCPNHHSLVSQVNPVNLVSHRNLVNRVSLVNRLSRVNRANPKTHHPTKSTVSAISTGPVRLKWNEPFSPLKRESTFMVLHLARPKTPPTAPGTKKTGSIGVRTVPIVWSSSRVIKSHSAS